MSARQDASDARQDAQEDSIQTVKSALYAVVALVAVSLLVLIATAVAIAVHTSHTASAAAANAVRTDLNAVVKKSCMTSNRRTIEKFNSFIDEIIQTRINTRNEHLRLNQFAQAKIDNDAIHRYRLQRIHVPTDVECAKPLLPKK